MPDTEWSNDSSNTAGSPDVKASPAIRREDSPSYASLEHAGYKVSFPSREGRVYGQINKAVRFKSGDLLFNVLPDNVCYHFSQETKRFTYVFELHWGPGTFLWAVAPDRHGNVYCTLSGIRTPPPIVDAEFGNWGAVAVVNPRKQLLKTVAEQGGVVDPYSVQVLPDRNLLIADFADFSGSGRVYTVDPVNGGMKVLAEGDYLVDPTGAFVDDAGVLWIANGDQVNQDGEVIGLDLASGQRWTLFGREGDWSGALLGVYPAGDDYVVATKNEWDQRVRSAVILIDKKTGDAERLLYATEDSPKFYSNVGSVIGTRLWTAECCDRELVEYDLNERKVVQTYDLSPIMGGHRGMRNSFDSISGVYAIP